MVACLSCAAQQPAKPQAASPTAKEARQRILTLPVGTFECLPNSTGKKRHCKDIPVVILWDTEKNKCIAQLPYHDFHVYTNKQKDDVTWKLIGPPGYKFDATKGIDITTSSGSNPAHVWENPKPVGNDGFSWTIKKNAPKDDFSHVANVVDPDGNACDAGDPVISNDAN